MGRHNLDVQLDIRRQPESLSGRQSVLRCDPHAKFARLLSLIIGDAARCAIVVIHTAFTLDTVYWVFP